MGWKYLRLNGDLWVGLMYYIDTMFYNKLMRRLEVTKVGI